MKKIHILLLCAVLAASPAFVWAQTPTSGGTGGQGGTPTSGTTGGQGGQSTSVGTGGQGGVPTSGGTGGQGGVPTSGGTGGNGSQSFYLQNPLNSKFNSVGGLVQGALEIFSYLVVLFAVLMLIWVGLQFVLAQGNPSKMNELKSWLLWIVVGVAIVIGARIIVTVVINTLQATGTVSPGVIQNAQNALQSTSPTP